MDLNAEISDSFRHPLRRVPSQSSGFSTNSCIKLQRTISGLHNVGKSPIEVLNTHYYDLTEHERSEIKNYKSIYFIGTKGIQKFNGRFCSKKGIYRGLSGDHLKYRYQIIKELGRGSFGIVFQCWDHKSSELVAVKIVKSKPKYRQAGEFENFLLDIVHEDDPSDNNCFVKKLKNFDFRGHLCIVFELLYCTLYDFLEQNEFCGANITVVKRITTQLLQGLKQLHNMHYLHSDLKPDNIMLKYQNKSRIKIIDLGSACFSYHKDVPRYLQTRYYRAPEIILGINYDASIDFWSLGCVVVELLTGTTLFQAPDEESLLYKIVGLIGEPPVHLIRRSKNIIVYFNGMNLKHPERIQRRSLQAILPNTPPACLDFISQCLTWDPDQRLNHERGLNHPWIKARSSRECQDRSS